MGGVDVVTDRGADPAELAGRDRGADARAADEHRARCGTVTDRLAHLARLVRIVDPDRIRIGAEIDRLVAERGERFEHGVTEMDAAMVEGHPGFPSPPYPPPGPLTP